MALRLRHWVGLTLTGCALAALRLLPPSELEFVQEAPPQEVVYERALRRDVARASAQLQRLRVAERVIPATLAERGPLSFGVPENTDQAEAERVRADALAEAQAALELGRAAARGGEPVPVLAVALGLHYVLPREDAYPGAPTDRMWDAEYYFGERDGRAYCVTVLPVWVRARDSAVRLEGFRNHASRLGVCAVVARFGLPGPAARRWLEDGGAAMASALRPSGRVPGAFSTFLGYDFERRASLGLVLAGGYGLGPLAMEQCLAGVATGCASLLLEPGSMASVRAFYGQRQDPHALLGATPLSAVSGQTALEPADLHVLADLEEEFGEERVRAWWTAGGTPAEAFLDAFGVEAGEWYAARVSELVTVSGPGPAVSPGGLLGVFLFLALATLSGGAWASRRRVA